MIYTSIFDQPGTDTQSWHASLSIELQGDVGSQPELGTRLVRATHYGPLYVQKPFYPEGKKHAHVYLLHPPGGLVSGDELAIDISVNSNAGVLITTPGAAKSYRARDNHRLQRQNVTLIITQRSSLEWFPQESIVYNGANTAQDMQVIVSSDSSYIGWEILCMGLPFANKPFAKGKLNTRLQVFEGDSIESKRLIYSDNIDISAGDLLLSSVCGFNGYPVNAYLLAKFPVDQKVQVKALVELLRIRLRELNAIELVAVTVMHSLCVGRYLGNSTGEAKRLFIELWKIMRPVLIGRDASLPRIWHT